MCVCAFVYTRPDRMALAALKQMSLYGKRIAVFGSERPWLEACALAAGAEKVVTIEYSHIISHHPSIEVITPEEAGRRWSNGSLGLFDAVASFSSLEHAGLGRYGDKLNPWGDIVAVGQAWCITRGDGLLLLAEPMAEQDVVLWNEARIYGPVMSPHLLANWEQVWRAPSTSAAAAEGRGH